MVHYCSVPFCQSKDKDGIVLHRIPKDLTKEFGDAIKRQNWIPSNSDRICEVNFLDFIYKKEKITGINPPQLFFMLFHE